MMQVGVSNSRLRNRRQLEDYALRPAVIAVAKTVVFKVITSMLHECPELAANPDLPPNTGKDWNLAELPRKQQRQGMALSRSRTAGYRRIVD